MIRINLTYFYVFFVFVVTVPFSYAQNVSAYDLIPNVAMIDVFDMTDEEFETYLNTLPRFNEQQAEELQRWRPSDEERHVVGQPVAPKRKRNLPLVETCNRQS